MAPPNHSHPELERGLGRLEGKVEGISKSLDAQGSQMTHSFREIKQNLHELSIADRRHNGQIGRLSGKKEWIMGGLAMLGFAIWLGFQIYSMIQ
jgi:hypothetical protein